MSDAPISTELVQTLLTTTAVEYSSKDGVVIYAASWNQLHISSGAHAVSELYFDSETGAIRGWCHGVAAQTAPRGEVCFSRGSIL